MTGSRFKALIMAPIGQYQTKSYVINMPNKCFNRATENLKSLSVVFLKRGSFIPGLDRNK